MSVLIKGMEMPTSCLECPLTDGHSASCLITEKSVYFSVDKRHDGCPLIPVPPHGKLIDADAFTKRLKTELEIALPLFKTETWKERSCEMVNAIVGELEEIPPSSRQRRASDKRE